VPYLGNAQAFEEPITPEEVSEVTRAFAERIQGNQRGPTPNASPTASSLAQVLGTTPDDIRAVLSEVRTRLASTPTASLKRRLQIGNLNLFLGIGAILLFTMNFVSVSRSTVSKFKPTPPSLIGGAAVLQYDPYAKGYTRELGPMREMFNKTTLVVDKTVVSPPQGVRVTLITPSENEIIAGAPGPIVDKRENIQRLRDSIRSLLAFEESKATVNNDIPIMPYEVAPFAGYLGSDPTVLGWHDVEISDGRNSFRALLPDGRYAKDLSAFESALSERLEWITDKKLFPSQHLYKLRPQAVKVSLRNDLPFGVELALYDNKNTVYAAGVRKGLSVPKDIQSLERQVKASFDELVERAANLDVFSGSKTNLSVLAVYPGGEHRAVIPPALRSDQKWGSLSDEEFRRNSEDTVVKAISGSVMAEGSLKPKGTITTRFPKRR
jgi:hypothetical protein